jgi:hypothetical protein
MKFLPNSEKAAEKKLADTRASRDALATRLAVAQDAVASASAALHQLAVEGAVDAALAAGEAKLRDTERRVATLAPALDQIEKLLIQIEVDRDAMLDKKIRAETAAATLALSDELTEIGAAFEASTIALNEVAARVVLISAEGRGLSVFTASAKIEVAAAVEVLAMVLREHSRAVLNHQAPAAMPKPAPEPVKPVPVVKEPLVTVFATRPIKWRDADNAQRASGKYVDVSLPSATAARALACGAALKLDHPERKRCLGTWPGHVSLQNCYDLDATDAAAPQREVVVHSAFQPIDRGPPFKLTIAGAAQ